MFLFIIKLKVFLYLMKRKLAGTNFLVALSSFKTLHSEVSMLAESDLKRLFRKLIRQFSAKINIFGSDININFFEHASKIQLSTPVYLGTNYIPSSVRSCIAQTSPFGHSLKTSFFIDEDNYRIILNFAGPLDHTEVSLFEETIEEFGSLASEWKSLLDERDKRDLIYVYQR